ncbi:MAG TPA: acetyl-CoA carboxylase biotin carboxyl carrier protein [Allosphingosinicella sp.]|jgi:acetyl-CoA carboxylase biotin carboxyl carrier protein|nr:acetyl-CoA carboxylase biotin carboxyl carrier protein [Allosphingosinicella sp.]
MTDERDAPAEGGMRIEAELVRQLAELLNQNDLTEIEVEDGDRRIVVKRGVVVAAAAPAPAAPPPPPPPPGPAPAGLSGAAVAPAAHPGAVKSPMVGTVFLSGEPGSKPFVAPGDKVKEGDTLLIVEAMKVMNQISAPRAGTVREILVVDAQPVEYDQPLVIIE